MAYYAAPLPPPLRPHCVVDYAEHQATGAALQKQECARWEEHKVASVRRAEAAGVVAAVSDARQNAARLTRDVTHAVEQRRTEVNIAVLAVQTAEGRLASEEAVCADARRAAEAAAQTLAAAKKAVRQPTTSEAEAEKHLRDMQEAARWPRKWLKRVSTGKTSVSHVHNSNKDRKLAEDAEAAAAARDEEARMRVREAMALLEAAKDKKRNADLYVLQCEREKKDAEEAVDRAVESVAAARSKLSSAVEGQRCAEQTHRDAAQGLKAAQQTEEGLAQEGEAAKQKLSGAETSAYDAEQAHRSAAVAHRIHTNSPPRTRILWGPSEVSRTPPPQAWTSPVSTGSSIGPLSPLPASSPGSHPRSTSPQRRMYV